MGVIVSEDNQPMVLVTGYGYITPAEKTLVMRHRRRRWELSSWGKSNKQAVCPNQLKAIRERGEARVNEMMAQLVRGENNGY